jgi:hypothetical protein
MPGLTIPSHMSGEAYITKAALIADDSTTVTVFPGTKMLLADYRRDAANLGYTLPQLYNLRHDKECCSDQEVEASIRDKQKDAAQALYEFLRQGVTNSDKRVKIDNNEALKARTSGSTEAVARHYAQGPREGTGNAQGASKAAEERMKRILFDEQNVSADRKDAIEKYWKGVGFQQGGKYVLFWGRKSGEKTGAGPALDTNEIMLAQMMIVLRRKDPQRKLVIIGDPVTLPPDVDGIPVPQFDIDLVQYWDHGFPGGRDLYAQMYFIKVIRTLCEDTVSIGGNSGILELPHLIGMKTVYLENAHLHARKGCRWQLLAANYKTSTEAELREAQNRLAALQLNGKANRAEQLEAEVQAIRNRRVDVLNKIRPGLQRFSTTTATDLWFNRKWLFDEVAKWLNAQTTVAPQPQAAHNAFLELMILAATANPEDRGTGNQPAPAWAAFHDAKKQWVTLRESKKPFSGSADQKSKALQAMAMSMHKHGLTDVQQQQFWETFNYTFVNGDFDNEPRPPDFRAAYHAWLKDTADVWTYVLGRSASI